MLQAFLWHTFTLAGLTNPNLSQKEKPTASDAAEYVTHRLHGTHRTMQYMHE